MLSPCAPPRWMVEMAAAVPGDPAMDVDDRERAEFAWLARRFLRRPASDADIASLRAAIDPTTAGTPREARLRAAVVALLLHPEFLFRIEHDPAPDAAERDQALQERETAQQRRELAHAARFDVAYSGGGLLLVKRPGLVLPP